MADGLNRAMLIGNLGAEPELRYTQNNRAVLKFRMATTESYADSDGQRKEITYWHSVVIWGKRGEALSKILTKGSQVYVEGRIETRSYDDKDGVKRSITEISASDLKLLGGRPAGQGASASAGGNGGNQRPAQNGPNRAGKNVAPDDAPPDFGGGDDDIPF